MSGHTEVPRDLLKQLLYGWDSEEQLSGLLRKHPELQPYHQVAIPMHNALMMVMTALNYQLIVPGSDLDSVEDILDPKFRNYLLNCFDTQSRSLKRPQLPDELMRNIILKAEDRDQAVDLFLTILAGLEYPDYLTEESYWLMSEIEPKFRNIQSDDARFKQTAKEMFFVWDVFLLRKCQYALRLCLDNGLNKQVVLAAISKI